MVITQYTNYNHYCNQKVYNAIKTKYNVFFLRYIALKL